jgi:hypothetical protein
MLHPRFALSVAIAAALALPPLPAIAAPTPRTNLHTGITAALLPYIRVQSCEGDCGPNDPPPRDRPSRYTRSDRDYDSGLSVSGTRRIEWLIADRIRHCEEYRPIWRIDCLADGFKQIARSLPEGAGYASIRQELSSTADELAALARKNADPVKPPERLRAQTSAGPRRTSRPLVPIAPQNLPAANRAADAIVADLSTTLLRSAPNPATQPEVARIAAAVDSTRVLLRSS